MTTHCHVIQFSPSPEDIDPVSVALLVWDASHKVHSIVFDASFPRLRAIAPFFSTAFLCDYLWSIERDVRELAPGPAVTAAVLRTRQLRIGRTVELPFGASRSALDMLSKVLLTVRHEHVVAHERGPSVVGLVQTFLRRDLRVPSSLIRPQRPLAEILPSRLLARLDGGPLLRPHRTVDGSRGILLCSGVDFRGFNAKDPSRVHLDASRMTALYRVLRDARSEIEDSGGIMLRLCAVAFHRERNTSYVADLVAEGMERYADVVAEPGKAGDLERLRQNLNAIGVDELAAPLMAPA